MDSPSSDELTSLDELCMICLTEKYVHLEHCNECHKCVRHFHQHSNFFNKCFGDSNIRPFILFHFLSLLQCILYLYLIGRAHWTDSASEFLIGKLMLTHSMMSSKVLVSFLILEAYAIYILDQCLVAFNALGNGLTINEYTNAKDYKYLFTLDKVKKSFDDYTVRHAHNKVSLGRFLVNPFLFFCACSRKPLRQQRAASYLLIKDRQNTSGDDPLTGGLSIRGGKSSTGQGSTSQTTIELRKF